MIMNYYCACWKYVQHVLMTAEDCNKQLFFKKNTLFFYLQSMRAMKVQPRCNQRAPKLWISFTLVIEHQSTTGDAACEQHLPTGEAAELQRFKTAHSISECLVTSVPQVDRRGMKSTGVDHNDWTGPKTEPHSNQSIKQTKHRTEYGNNLRCTEITAKCTWTDQTPIWQNNHHDAQINAQ